MSSRSHRRFDIHPSQAVFDQAVYNQKGRAEQLRPIGVLDIERSQEPETVPFVW